MLLRHHTEKKKTSKTSQPNLARKTFTLKKSILPPRLSCVLAMIRDLAFGPVSSQKVRTKLAPRWFSPKSRKIIVETTTICCSFFFRGENSWKIRAQKHCFFRRRGGRRRGAVYVFPSYPPCEWKQKLFPSWEVFRNGAFPSAWKGEEVRGGAPEIIFSFYSITFHWRSLASFFDESGKKSAARFSPARGPILFAFECA